MNKKERAKMVKAMEFIARQLNDEDDILDWLVCGVADGDIDYGDLDGDYIGNVEYWLKDENFAELMHDFTRIMRNAYCNGGLYCDGVLG